MIRRTGFSDRGCAAGRQQVPGFARHVYLIEYSRTLRRRQLRALFYASELAVTIDETVLSLSFDSEKSKRREAALRSSGFEVISAHSPTQARYEIETGRCGIFVTCRTVPDIVNRHLMELFKRYCPTGWIIFVTGSEASRT